MLLARGVLAWQRGKEQASWSRWKVTCLSCETLLNAMSSVIGVAELRLRVCHFKFINASIYDVGTDFSFSYTWYWLGVASGVPLLQSRILWFPCWKDLVELHFHGQCKQVMLVAIRSHVLNSDPGYPNLERILKIGSLSWLCFYLQQMCQYLLLTLILSEERSDYNRVTLPDKNRSDSSIWIAPQKLAVSVWFRLKMQAIMSYELLISCIRMMNIIFKWIEVERILWSGRICQMPSIRGYQWWKTLDS